MGRTRRKGGDSASLVPNDSTFEDKLRTAYMAYLIFRGLNFFFGPTFIGPTNDGIPISDYAQMQQALGLPTAPATDSQYGTDPGFRLSRSNVAYLRFVDLLQYVGAARATPVLTELV